MIKFQIYYLLFYIIIIFILYYNKWKKYEYYKDNKSYDVQVENIIENIISDITKLKKKTKIDIKTDKAYNTIKLNDKTYYRYNGPYIDVTRKIITIDTDVYDYTSHEKFIKLLKCNKIKKNTYEIQTCIKKDHSFYN